SIVSRGKLEKHGVRPILLLFFRLLPLLRRLSLTSRFIILLLFGSFLKPRRGGMFIESRNPKHPFPFVFQWRGVGLFCRPTVGSIFSACRCGRFAAPLKNKKNDSGASLRAINRRPMRGGSGMSDVDPTASFSGFPEPP